MERLPIRTNACVKVTITGNQPGAQEALDKPVAGKEGASL
jgi:hypothetical protein